MLRLEGWLTIVVGATWTTMASAQVSLPWSTTFDCAPWSQAEGSQNLQCDGLAGHGDWVCSDPSGSHEEQLTAEANRTAGPGGVGQRHFKGMGDDNNSGGLRIEFGTSSEMWVRWYQRYQQGFGWDPSLNYDKMIYIDVLQEGWVVAGWSGMDQCVLTVAGTAYYGGAGTGWSAVMGGSEADGRWHCHELHLAMDTDGTNGIAEWSIDGAVHLSRSDVDFLSSQGKTGWNTILFGSNQRWPAQNVCMAVDYDDLAVSATGPLGCTTDGGGGSGEGGGTAAGGGAGAGGSSSASGGGGHGSAEGGDAARPADGGDDGGCGCRFDVTGPRLGRPAELLLLAGVGLWLRRRRRF